MANILSENISGFMEEWKASFYPGTLIPALVTSLVISLLTMVLSVSFVVLIFVDPLQGFTAYGTHLMLLTAVIVALSMALFSSYAGTIGIPQDRIAPIVALMAGQIILQMRGTSDPVTIGYTVLTAIACSTLLTGLALYLLGKYQMGNVVRFIPYPVIGGFLAGSGWLLLTGSFHVMSGGVFSVAGLQEAAATGTLMEWLGCVAFAVTGYLLVRTTQHYLTLPLYILCSVMLFYSWLAWAHFSIADAQQNHWILRAPAGSDVLLVKMFSGAIHAHWLVILQRYDSFGAIILTSVVSILLNTSALELAANEDMDLNQELRAAGLANLFGGSLGGMVGFHSLSLSSLSLGMGVRHRLVSLFSALICLAVLLFGTGLLSYVPRFVLGGLLFYTGFGFLVEWTFDSYRKLVREDYYLIILILAIVAVGGYLQGVAAGILIATVLFVAKYSTVNVISRAVSGDDTRSAVDRSAQEERMLLKYGSRIYLLRLKGYIFFGSANSILNNIKERFSDPGPLHLRYVILDFHHVSGLDTSAMLSLSKLVRLARKEDFTLLLSGASAEVQNNFRRTDLIEVTKENIPFFRDRDHALEWCEDDLLRRELPEDQQREKSILSRLQESHLLQTSGEDLLHYLEKMDVEKNYYLMLQGEAADELFFIHSGRVRVMVELDNGQVMRVRTMGAGTVVGEIGLYLGQNRVASVVTEGPCQLYRLSQDALRRMDRENPPLATAFHEFMVRLLAERVTQQNRTLRALAD